MATSDSDDFESADEELVPHGTLSRKSSNRQQQWHNSTTAIDSESDDDNECVPSVIATATTAWNSGNRGVSVTGQSQRASTLKDGGWCADASTEARKNANGAKEMSKLAPKLSEDKTETVETMKICADVETCSSETSRRFEPSNEESLKKLTLAEQEICDPAKKKNEKFENDERSADTDVDKRDRPQRRKKAIETKGMGAKKLGSKISVVNVPKPPPVDAQTPDEVRKMVSAEGNDCPTIEDCWEFDEEETAKILKGLSNVDNVRMPEELKSEKKFKEIFKPDGWEGLNDESILTELEEDGVRPILDKIVKEEPSNTGWGGWGSWGMDSIINSATAGVSTLTSHVTHGLTLLDEAMAASSHEEFPKNDAHNDAVANSADKSCGDREIQPQLTFGLNDLLSGVSSITKLVETTGTKVITGGLGTLETIGKKTMEVLQEGDPGLKKKRAFFMNEIDKPILSKMLREAKEKAEIEEKTLEERQSSRKVHFESLFDDYQGLVHLEALEMLSKQCNMKIQHRLVTLDADELTSIQETLEEVKELCDLGDEDDNQDDKNEDNLKEKLEAACKDLGVTITYEKLDEIWKDVTTSLSEISSMETKITDREFLQRAISTLARFTAFSVERFHKTAELLLIKEHRSTVNEADALVQLTRILSGQISIAANLFTNSLNEQDKKMNDPECKINITTIFLEAANASSYIQDAFRLLIPILQVGAI